MSKLALLLVVPAVAALGGLAAWNVSLSQEVADLRREAAPAEAAPAPTDRTDAPREATRQAERVRSLEGRLAELETTVAKIAEAPPETAQATAGSDGGAEETAVPADMPAAYASPDFTRAVHSVMDAREEARRRERLERTADNLARAWLRDLTVSDSQRADVVRTITDFLVRQDQIRQDEALSDEERRARVEQLQDERDATFTAILGSAHMEVLRPRLETRRRGGGPQGAQGRPFEREPRRPRAGPESPR